MIDSTDESSAAHPPGALPECHECGNDERGCFGSLLMLAILSAPVSFIAGVAGCILESRGVDDQRRRTLVILLLMAACWVCGLIGVIVALLSAAVREGKLARYLPLTICIAAPLVPTIVFYYLRQKP